MYLKDQNFNMKKTILFSFIFLLSYASKAQLTIGNGKNQIEISGFASTYYNQRFYKPESTNFRKNRFRLRDAQLQIEGRVNNRIEYELQVDFANFDADFDPENPPIRDGYVMYKFDYLDVKAGYQKVPYSLASLVPFAFSPYFQRAEVVRGDFFGRRDVGLTLSKDFWQNRIVAYAGTYTGMGEISLRGDNDRSGKLEYIGRLEFSFPGKVRYRFIDHISSVKPQFAIGVNARHAEKETTTGQEYQLKTLDGTKTTYGADVNFLYKGFSAQFEIHQSRVTPNDSTRFFNQANPGYFLAGGYYGQVSYFYKPWQMALSARFEELNLNNYYEGINQRVSFAYLWLLDGFNSSIKIQYTIPLLEEQNDFFPEAVAGELNWTAQLRIGWQYRF